MIRICSGSQIDRARPYFSVANGIARISVQGGLYPLVLEAMPAGSYGLPPSSMARPAGQYSAKSARGQLMGVTANAAEITMSATSHLRAGWLALSRTDVNPLNTGHVTTRD